MAARRPKTKPAGFVSENGTQELAEGVPELLELFRWDGLRALLQEAFGLPQLFCSADPLGGVYLNFFERGDQLGWHFDRSEYSVNLILRECPRTAAKAGQFMYLPDSRPFIDARVDDFDVAQLGSGLRFDGLSEVVEPDLQPGTLYLFAGNRSLHCVSENTTDVTRVNAIFTFNPQPDVALNAYTRRKFFDKFAYDPKQKDGGLARGDLGAMRGPERREAIAFEKEELQKRVRSAEQERQQSESQMDSTRHEVRSLQSQLEALKGERAAILAHLASDKQQRQALQHQSGALAKEVQTLRQRVTKSAEEAARLRSEFRVIDEELKMMRQQNEAEEQNRKALEQKVEEIQQQRDSQRQALRRVQQQNRDLHGKMGALHTEQQVLKSQVSEAVQEKKSLEQKIGREEASHASLTSRVSGLQRDIKKLKSQEASAEQAAAAGKR
ncbi:unnamed protein product [Effrenium voratum]|nr:unnamed protein product [Effrenium voratum]